MDDAGVRGGRIARRTTDELGVLSASHISMAQSQTGYVTSKDGTRIAYERQGRGAPVILVTGALDDGTENEALALELARSFTVYNYARRGRGASGDTLPYTVERELHDIDALIAEAGGPAHVFGVSSGGMFVFEAAAAGSSIDRIAVYEVPYDTADDARPRIEAYREQLGAAIAAGRRGEAVELFMRLAGSSEQDIARARGSTYWPGVEALAHTLAYDAALYGPPPTDRLTRVAQPTLVLTGGAAPFFESAADAIAAALPHSEQLTLSGQGHVADPKALGSTLERFFMQR
jgi:pimeloyl-ACP methyl ester carboxylesterase